MLAGNAHSQTTRVVHDRLLYLVIIIETYHGYKDGLLGLKKTAWRLIKMLSDIDDFDDER